jgi:hypothetical protein
MAVVGGFKLRHVAQTIVNKQLAISQLPRRRVIYRPWRNSLASITVNRAVIVRVVRDSL